MKEWEKRYEHVKDMRDAQCLAEGIKIPKDEKYGVLTVIKGLWRSFSGPLFWQHFKDFGHDSTVFEQCKCIK
jgi:hypothetical protein